MFGSLFNREKSISFPDFLAQIKAGKRNFFEVLQTPEKNFEEASFEELMSNTDDVLAEVNRVQKNFRNTYFGMFGNCLIKHHDDGDVKWIFYTVSKDDKKILALVDALNAHFGLEHYDDEKFIPFKRTEKVMLLSRGVTDLVEADLLSLWFHENVTALLQYKKSPLQQLSLMVTTKKPKEKDTAIRRRTILELIEQDVNNVVRGHPIEIKRDMEDGEIKSTELTYRADKKIFGVFDRVRFRQFGKVEEYMPGLNTNLTLYSTTPIDSDHKIAIAERLVKLYGSDSSGTGEIKIHERDTIEASEFWTGRNWYFNLQHGLWDSTDKSQKMSYWVSVDDFEDEERFKVSVLSYNTLIELFGLS